MTDMEFENQLRAIASEMKYPHTPDVARHVMTRLRSSTHPRFFSRKLSWSLTIVLILISSLALIPPVRAAVIEFFQIGVVRIFPRTAEPAMEVIYTATPEAVPPMTATPGTSPQSLLPVLDKIAGETTLEHAQEVVGYSILLPTYPPDLGRPNHVYVQDVEGAMTILVWMDPSHPENVKMSLHFIPNGSWVINKMGPKIIQEILVNNQRGVWAEGPYPLKIRNGDIEFIRLIEGHVLIWAGEDITYRLETDLSMEEAIKIAESLEPIP